MDKIIKNLHTAVALLSDPRFGEIEKDIVLDRLRSAYSALKHTDVSSTVPEAAALVSEPVVLPVDESANPTPDQTTTVTQTVGAATKDGVDSLPIQETDSVTAEHFTETEAEDVHAPVADLFQMNTGINPAIIRSLYGDDPLPAAEKNRPDYVPSTLPVDEVTPTDTVSLRKTPAVENLQSDQIPGGVETVLQTSEPPAQQKELPLVSSSGECLNDIIADSTPVLGDVMASNGGAVLNDMLEKQTSDIASVLASQSAGSLRDCIGLNERFLLMSDLFHQDESAYERTLDALDACASIEDAYIFLQENFSLDPSKEGVQRMLSLLERKFS